MTKVRIQLSLYTGGGYRTDRVPFLLRSTIVWLTLRSSVRQRKYWQGYFLFVISSISSVLTHQPPSLPQFPARSEPAQTQPTIGTGQGLYSSWKATESSALHLKQGKFVTTGRESTWAYIPTYTHTYIQYIHTYIHTQVQYGVFPSQRVYTVLMDGLLSNKDTKGT